MDVSNLRELLATSQRRFSLKARLVAAIDDEDGEGEQAARQGDIGNDLDRNTDRSAIVPGAFTPQPGAADGNRDHNGNRKHASRHCSCRTAVTQDRGNSTSFDDGQAERTDEDAGSGMDRHWSKCRKTMQWGDPEDVADKREQSDQGDARRQDLK